MCMWLRTATSIGGSSEGLGDAGDRRGARAAHRRRPLQPQAADVAAERLAGVGTERPGEVDRVYSADLRDVGETDRGAEVRLDVLEPALHPGRLFAGGRRQA